MNFDLFGIKDITELIPSELECSTLVYHSAEVPVISILKQLTVWRTDKIPFMKLLLSHIYERNNECHHINNSKHYIINSCNG